MSPCLLSTWMLLLAIFYRGVYGIIDFQGPTFVHEPPSFVDFSNATGKWIECAARGSPPPVVKWALVDGTAIVNIPGLRQVLSNGTLHFAPFRADDYRPEVHAVTYKCFASNPSGVVVSRDVKIRAVVLQIYEVQVYDEYIIRGNTAVMKCHIPSFVKDYVTVDSWMQEQFGENIPVKNGDKYLIVPTGELYILNVQKADGLYNYRCRTSHRLTGETRMSGSSPSGALHVTEPRGSVSPRITDSRPSITARQGDLVMLPCAAQGYPLPNYSWQKKTEDGLFLPITYTDDVRKLGGVLVISNAKESHGGHYTCEASNSMGNVKFETLLVITAPLSALVYPQRQTVNLGESATLNCVVSGFPVMYTSWVKDGKFLTHDNINHQQKEVLRINSVQKHDRGMYQCFVSNEMEIAQGTAELRLGDTPPEFQKVFISKTLSPGSFVSLQCVVSGNPTPEVLWNLDDLKLADNARYSKGEYIDGRGDVVSHVNISSANVEDGGEYMCKASNRAGKIEHRAKVNVYGDPYIRLPSQVSVVASKNLTVRCHVAGFPIEPVIWERDGKILPTNHRQRVLHDGTLIIENVQRSHDGGHYTCVARNPNGRSDRRDMEVIVLVPPEIMPFPDVHLNEGMRAQITCAISQGDPPIRIQFLKDGQPIPATLLVNERNFDQYSSSLSIENVKSVHSGNYTCLANNPAAETRYTMQLFVNVPPRWLVSPRDSHVLLGSSITINCKADGFPKPIITWMKALGNTPSEYREVSLASAHLRHHPNGSLQIVNTRQSDGGYYLCKANNSIGAGLSQVVHLYVHVPAHFQTKYRNITAKVGESSHFVCEAMGDKQLTITWYLNRQQLHPEVNPRYQVKEDHWDKGLTSRLVIITTEKQDGGSYSCVVQNEFGDDKTIIQLTVLEFPSAPINAMVTDRSSRSVQLRWSEPNDGNSPITRYTIQYKPATGSWRSDARNATVLAPEHVYAITGLYPATQYHFRLFAINEVGIGPPSDVIDAETAMEAPGGPPEDVQVNAVDPKTLKVTWKPPKPAYWHGEISGYNVGYRMYDSTEAHSFKTVNAPSGDNSEVDTEDELNVELQNLKKFTKYSVVVQAFNRHGTGPTSDEVTAQTMEDAPSKPPENLRCSSLSSQSLLVTWEPPPKSGINGHLQGFKVLYAPAVLWYDGMDPEVKSTSAWKTIIHGLDKYNNYSIQVLAFTHVGDGVRSRPIFCQTQEDVPDAPSEIKALTISMDSIHVVWRVPQRTNGVITKYTLYSRNADSDQDDMTKHIISSEYNSHEVRNLREGRRYEFWVTASTSIGEGQSTKVVSQTPGPNVPARIVGFDDHISTRWRDNVALPCRTVGIPNPEREWKFEDQTILRGERKFWEIEGALQILDIQSTDTGNYSCRVRNLHGTDKISYHLTVQAPPGPPTLLVGPATYTSISLLWRPGLDGGGPIEEYNLHYKRDFGEWESVSFSAKLKSSILEGLWCGTRYQLYMTARNRIGVGEASQSKTVRTKGSAPEPPPKEKLLKENSTFIMLNLASWEDGGCRILYFVIEYKPRSQSEWMLVSNNVNMQKEQYAILDLQPDVWYNLRVTAHNSAGSSVEEYEFMTRSHAGVFSRKQPGASIPQSVSNLSMVPGVEVTERNNKGDDYLDLKILFPILAFLIVLITAIVAIYCFRSQRESPTRHAGTSREAGKHYEARYISSSSTIKKPPNMAADFDKGGAVGGGDELQPYATYQLPPDGKTENFTAEDWKKYETYADGQGSENPDSSRAVGSGSGSGNIYPMLKKEEGQGPDSSLSDDQEYASPVRSSDTSDSNSGSCQAPEGAEASMQGPRGPRPMEKLRKPGRRAKVPDLIYRRQQECCGKPLTPPCDECENTLCRVQPIKIPRPQLEKPSAPAAETTIDSQFSFLDNMGSSQESSDTTKKDENGDKQSSRDSSSTDCENRR